LGEAMKIVGEKSEMSRDAVRSFFGVFDLNKDKMLSFEEIYANLLA